VSPINRYMRLLKRVEDNGGDTGRIMGSERRGGRRLSVDIMGSEENLWLFLLRLRVFVDGGVLSMVVLKKNNSIPALYGMTSRSRDFLSLNDVAAKRFPICPRRAPKAVLTKVLRNFFLPILNDDHSTFVRTFHVWSPSAHPPHCADDTDTRRCHCFLKGASGHPSCFPLPRSLLFLLPRPSASHFNCFIIPVCSLLHGFFHYSRRRLLVIRCHLCLQRRYFLSNAHETIHDGRESVMDRLSSAEFEYSLVSTNRPCFETQPNEKNQCSE
jgi:hypothetical protein